MGKNMIGGTFEDIREAIVKPVTDEVGRVVEQGMQTATASIPNPQNTQSQTPKSTDPNPQDEAGKSEVRRIIAFHKDLSDNLLKVRQANQQKQKQAIQQAQQKKEINQFETVKKQKKDIALEQATKKTEVRGGVGG